MRSLKIVFTGPESTGKSTLSGYTAATYGGRLFPEFAREYLLERGGKYSFSDLEVIGKLQAQQRQVTDPLQVHDTANEVLYIWSMYKYQKCSSFIKEMLHQQDYALYFLCSPKGVDWEEDPLREHPNQREELFQMYKDLLIELKVNFVILEGDIKQRQAKIDEVTKGLFKD